MKHRIAQSETEIPATPAEVWRVLCDLDSYREWNPAIVSAEGVLSLGKTFHFRQANGMRFHPRVVQLQPERLLQWQGSVLVRGLLDGLHTFTIDELPEGARLRQHESFSGLAAFTVSDTMLRAVEEDMRSADAALAARVLALRGQRSANA